MTNRNASGLTFERKCQFLVAATAILLLCLPVSGQAQQGVSALETGNVKSKSTLKSYISPSALLAIGVQAVEAIDEGGASDLWSSASPAIRSLVSDSDFLIGVSKMREGYSRPTSRVWVGVSIHQRKAEGKLPAAIYANAEFETEFAKDGVNTVRREMVTFRLDQDRKWRFSGYTLR